MMKGLLEQLVRLQELNFAKQEHEAAGSRMGIRRIEALIQEILHALPLPWARLVQRLQGEGQPAVVPATNGVCAFCRIQLPTSMVQEIRKSLQIHQCPCCARILYIPHGGEMQALKRASPPGKGGIARFSSRSLMIPRLKARQRDEALEEMVQVMAKGEWIQDPDRILRAAIHREDLVTTAVDYGLAFPHVRGVDGSGLIFALGLNKRGLHFGAPAGRLTRILFFAIVPQAASGFYLKALAALVRTFREEPARKRILMCRTPDEVWDTLVDLTQDTFP